MIRSPVYAGLIVSLSIFACSGTLQGLVPRIYSQYGGGSNAHQVEFVEEVCCIAVIKFL